jgi:hypothetical protein
MKAFCYIAKNLKYCVDELMTKAGNIFLLLFIFSFNSAQSQYFNVRIDFMGYGLAEVGFSIEKMDDGNYLVFHGARPESGDNLGLGRTIVNQEGEVLNQMIHLNENSPLYIGHKNTSSKIPGGYITSGTRSWFTSTLESQITLNRYNEDGELLWIKFYGDQIYQSTGRAATKQGEVFAACGSIGNENPNDGDGFLLIADSLGNLLDFKIYGGNSADAFSSIFPTQDGGYVMGGYTWSYGTLNIFDHYIVKTDSMGNQEWMRVIGSPRNDCSAGVIQTLDGNYVFCGCWNNYNASPTNPNSTGYKTLFLAKLDSAGQTIWQKEFTEPTIGAALFVVKELPDGGLISAGNRIAGKEAVLLRTDADGNEMWIRYLTHPSVENGSKLFHDVIVDEDGGFVGTGYLFGTSNDPQPGQDLWVFRTDSMGCLVPGCHLTDIIEVNEKEVLVSLYPNPVKDLLSVHIKSGPMPRGAQLELFDLHGRQHSTTPINPGATTYILQLGHLPAGLYVLRCVTDNEVVWSGKVVKE